MVCSMKITTKNNVNELPCVTSEREVNAKNIKRALHAIKLKRAYFTNAELNKLLTSNFYSILYYNYEIWMIPTPNQFLKQQVLSALTASLKMCTRGDTKGVSFVDLHIPNKSATPQTIYDL